MRCVLLTTAVHKYAYLKKHVNVTDVKTDEYGYIYTCHCDTGHLNEAE